MDQWGADAVTKDEKLGLKKKVIEDFCYYINRLESGYFDDYSKIKNSILFIEYCSQDPKIYEFLLSN